MLVTEHHAVLIQADDAIVGDGHAKDVTSEIAQHSLIAFAPVASGTTRSGRRFDSAALSLPRTSFAKAANGTRKPLRAGCHSCPSSDTPPPVTRQWTWGWYRSCCVQVCRTARMPTVP